MLDKEGQRWTFGFCDVVSLQPNLRMISKTRRYPFNKPFIVQSKPRHLCLQTSYSTIQTGYNRRTMRLQLTPDPLSFGSRSVLVHFSLGPRSSLVRLSLLIR